MPGFIEQFNTVICNQFGIAPEQILPECRFKEDLGADSLDMAELLIEFENVFIIYISDSEADHIKTVGQALDCIKEKVEQQDDSSHKSIL